MLALAGNGLSSKTRFLSRSRGFKMTAGPRNLSMACLLLGTAAVPCFGWGHVGHMVTGDIAWHHLNIKTKAAVRDILGAETLFYASTWPDRVRSQEEYDWIKPYHYINVPRGEASYDHSSHCAAAGCVVSGITANANILRDAQADTSQKKQALRLLAHFVGDLHQPLHVGYEEDLGGNAITVRFFGRKYTNKKEKWKVNLHKIWDNLVIERRMELLGDLGWDDYAERLNAEISDTQNAAWTNPSNNSLLSWADTSYQLARIHAYRDTTTAGQPSPDTNVKKNDDLRSNYYDQAVPVIERRLKEGGVRLAAILNAIFSSEVPLPFNLGSDAGTGMHALIASHAADETIRMATFNIQIFGKTKAGKPEVMDVLAEIVRTYDIVAVQEIKDADNTVPGIFLSKLNEDGSQYGMAVSPRTGMQEDDQHSREQYAYYFDTNSVEQIGASSLYDDGTNDSFQREPFAARFQATAGDFTFVMISIHTAPEEAVTEIEALHDVVQWAQTAYADEDDFIVLGDFNAACSYASTASLDALSIRGGNYTWVVGDDADTNLADSQCAYDRIVFTSSTSGDFAGSWGVDRKFTDKKISDHWPVWADFYVDRDQQ